MKHLTTQCTSRWRVSCTGIGGPCLNSPRLTTTLLAARLSLYLLATHGWARAFPLQPPPNLPRHMASGCGATALQI
eukprot:scaffold182405_cov29-Tisochrysis_lutea.AAC.9